MISMSEENGTQKSTRNKSILSMEAKLNELVSTDIQNEEIYKILVNMAHIYINQNKFYCGYFGVDEVCHDVAADVWMKVIDGAQIRSWMYYIGKMIKLSYVTNQKNIEHEVIDVQDDPVLRDKIKRMCASSSMSNMKEFDDMERNLMLDNIPAMIYNTMEHTKFKPRTKEFLAVYNNVCFNLYNDLHGKDYKYFRIPEVLEPYVSIIIEQFKKEFRNSGFTESISDNVEDDLEMMLVTNENYMKEVSKNKA